MWPLSASGLVTLEQVEKAICASIGHMTITDKTDDFSSMWTRYPIADVLKMVRVRLTAPAAPAQPSVDVWGYHADFDPTVPAQPRPLTPEEQHAMQEFGDAVQRDVIDPLVEKEKKRTWGVAQPAAAPSEGEQTVPKALAQKLLEALEFNWSSCSKEANCAECEIKNAAIAAACAAGLGAAEKEPKA
jgi:hypothetical protein